MPSVVDQRLASRLHQQQVALLGHADAISTAVGRVYNKLIVDLAALAVSGSPDPAAVRKLVDQAYLDAGRLMQARMTDVVQWSYQATADVFAKTVPPAWWKVWLMKRRLAVSHHRLPRRVPESEEPFDYVDELEPVRQRDDSSWPSTPDAAREFVKSTVFPPLSKEHAQAMLDRPGPNNLTWEQRFRNYGKPDQDRIHRELSDGISSGENVVQIRKRMEGIVGGPRYRAQLIARTESTRVAGEATAAAGERTLGDMIEGKQMVVTMDQWTRPAHAALNGKMYYRTGPDVYVAKDGQPFPGDHHGPNCRCYGSIVLKPPEKFADDPALRAEFKTARAQDIPDPSSYSEWFMSASEPARRTAVGVRRYNAVLDVIADRRPEWTDFIDAEGGLLAPRTIQREKPRQRDERKAAVDALIGQRAMQFQHVYSQGFVTPTQNLAPADRTVIAGLQAEPPPLKRAAKRKRKP